MSALDERSATREIFLARDASFMYYARRAQLLGRGESANKVVLINFSQRMLTAGFSQDELREYLASQGVTDVSDAVFVDTGWHGTIPAYLLTEVFEFQDEKEVNRHILLLESKNSHRQILRMKAGRITAKDIEDSIPKPEDSATGLYRDEKSGKVLAYSEPSRSALAYLQYDIFKYLCMRHFYLQGRSERGM
jgi:hypothetical protein